MKQILIIAKMELYRLFKNRWLFVFTFLFTLLSLILIFVSQDIYKDLKDAGYTRYASAIYNLILMFVPLISLILASQSLAGDKADNFLSLLKTYPLKLMQYILGKYWGLFLALLASILVGFGVTAIISLFILEISFLINILYLTILSIALLFVFTSWGILIGSKAKNRLSALTTSLIVWFCAVFVYELLIWFLLPRIEYIFQKIALLIFILINPAESIRIGNIFLQKQGAIFGADFYYWQLNFNTPLGYLGGATLIFTYALLPIAFTIFKLKKN